MKFIKQFYRNYTNLIRDKAFINNEWVNAKSGNQFQVLNPATLKVITNVPDMNEQDAELAVYSAHQAYKLWKTTTAKERSNHLRKWYEIVMKNQENLAKLITAEMGKPLAEAKAEVIYAADYIEWFAEEAKRVYGDHILPSANNKRMITIKQPIGVAALITPWNFPIAMLIRKAAAALAAGCTTVSKPSEDTPLSALAMAQLGMEAGLPAGLFNIVTSSREKSPAVGEYLCKHPNISKISFTGSTAVGKILLSHCAIGVKKVSMELGGNAPFIVFNSANVKVAVQGAIASKFRNMGQTCVCSNRIMVQEGIHDEFVKEMIQEVSKFKLGNGAMDGVNQGPLINLKAVDKVDQHVKDAVNKGGMVVLGGKITGEKNNFYEPTIITGVTSEFLCSKEETFGPLAPILKFKTEKEAIDIANSTVFGLAGYLFTEDISQAWRVAEDLQMGIVGINEGIVSNVQSPFGGIKESGFGREGSKYGIEEYLNLKYICFGIDPEKK